MAGGRRNTGMSAVLIVEAVVVVTGEDCRRSVVDMAVVDELDQPEMLEIGCIQVMAQSCSLVADMGDIEG